MNYFWFFFLLVFNKIFSSDVIDSCVKGDKYHIYYLLDAGYDPNVPDEASGWTPLIYAASENDIELATILILAGADINKSSKDGWTPIIFAATLGFRDMTLLLLKFGANPSAKSISGMSAVKGAQIQNHHELVQLLTDAVHVHKMSNLYTLENGLFSEVLEASHNGNIDVLVAYQQQGHDLNEIKSLDGYNCLQLATASSQYEIISYLLNYGMNPNKADYLGWTPLMFAAYEVNILHPT